MFHFRNWLFGLMVMAIMVPTMVIGAPAPSPTPAPTVTCADGTTSCVALRNPLIATSTDPIVIVGVLIRSVLLLVGSVTLLMFVWGGFQWLTSGGNEEKVQKGSQTMLWASIGVFLIFASYLILTTYLNLLTGKS
jgi:hypothetical protein